MYKHIKILTIFVFLILLVAACGSTQQAPPMTPETVEVPVTVEVTRFIEVEKEIVVEVTRIVVETVIETVEVEIPVEVTRIVEVEVTPTPEPTEEASTTSRVVTTSGFSDSTLLTSMETVRTKLLDLGGMLDGRTLYCDTWIERHDAIANMPTYDTSYANDTSKWAYEQYRSAINTFVFESKDLTTNARESCVPGSSIPFQQWGTARQGINHAIDILQPAIKELGGQ